MPIHRERRYQMLETVRCEYYNALTLNKEETDIHFRQLTHKILQEGSWIQLCLASHNFYDHSFAEVLRKMFSLKR